MDTANPNPQLLSAVVRLTDLVPSLRVVIDHLPQMEMPKALSTRSALPADLRELGRRPQIYAKISEVLRRVDDRVPDDLNFYRAKLDELWEIFGPDRLIYGSDWPNSDRWGEYPEAMKIVREYITGKGAAAAEKVFWKNSLAAYRWINVTTDSPANARSLRNWFGGEGWAAPAFSHKGAAPERRIFHSACLVLTLIPAIHSFIRFTASRSTIEVASGGIWPRSRFDIRWRRTDRSGLPGAMRRASGRP
jgi:hypothetical protein